MICCLFFFTTEIGVRIGLTKSPLETNSRQPVSINDTYYIEGNIDNVGKFDRIKQALTIFDLEYINEIYTKLC